MKIPKITISKCCFTQIESPPNATSDEKCEFSTISVLDPQFGDATSQEDGSNFIRYRTKWAANTVVFTVFAFVFASHHAKYQEIHNSENYDFSTIPHVLKCYVRDPTNVTANSCTLINSASNGAKNIN